MEHNISIDIITRHTRSAGNLKRVAESLKGFGNWYVLGNDPSAAADLNCVYLKCDLKKPDHGTRLNYYFDNVPNGGQWTYILDDDNLLHPDFQNLFSKLDPDCKLAIFHQQINPATVRVALPEHIEVEWIDSAQYIARRDFIGDLRHWNVYRHDGYFVQELAIRARYEGVKFQILPTVYAYYNAQTV